MALTRVDKVGNASTTNATSYPTASFTVNAGELVLVFASVAATATTLSVSGLSQTWNALPGTPSVVWNAGATDQIRGWYAIVSSGATGALTISSTVSAAGALWSIFAYTGYDTAAPLSNASVLADTDNPAGPIDVSALTGLLTVWGAARNTTATDGSHSGGTIIHNVQHGSPTRNMITFEEQGENSPSVTWASNFQSGMIAFKVRIDPQTITFDAAGSEHAGDDLTVSSAGAGPQTVTFDAAGSDHAGADVVVVGDGAATITFDSATSEHAGTDLVVVGDGSATISFDAAGSEHAGADIAVTAGGTPPQTISFDAAASEHAGNDLVVVGDGAATISFDQTGSEHAGSDLTVVGDGAATISFDSAQSEHGAADVTLVGDGAATIAFEGAGSEHLATDFDVFSLAPGTISFDGADTQHAAADITVTGSGSATISFDAAGSEHAATDFDVEPGGAAAISFDSATTGHAAADLTLTAAGAAAISFDPATSLHGATDFAVSNSVPTPGVNPIRLSVTDCHRVAVSENHRASASTH